MTETLFDIFPQVKETSLPTIEQINDIIYRLQHGDEHAEEDLKLSCMRFVASVARHYLDMGLSKDELLAAGTEGLLVAGKKCDPMENFRFIPYAMYWIRQGIINKIHNK